MSVSSPRDFAELRPGKLQEEQGRKRLRQVARFAGSPVKIFSGNVEWLRAPRPEPDRLPENSLRPGVPLGGRLKRAFDIVVASLAIVALAPLYLALAAAIKLTKGGPVFYTHERVGFAGRRFRCFKFRTMVADSETVLRTHLANCPAAAAEWKLTRKLTNDPRITMLGAFLRKTSLDELPQFFNILRGEMSCVGPRPIVSEELELYSDKVGDYLCARPGVTGLWQISGRSSTSYEQRVSLDSQYARRWSFSKDLAIMVRTLPAVLKFEDAV
jgi:exopolysaccharide production protein ExoY